MLSFKKGIEVKNTINKKTLEEKVDEIALTLKKIEGILLSITQEHESTLTEKQKAIKLICDTIVIKGDQIGLTEEDYLRRAIKSLTYNRAKIREGGNPDIYQPKIDSLELAISMLRSDE